MVEEEIYIRSGGLRIQALIDNVPGDKAAVITHPHPLYGGDMFNPVVETLVRTYRNQGYTTLRFNFRGAGRSEGRYDQGLGEQQDLRSAVEYLQSDGKRGIDLAGYSFGAWVNALAVGDLDEAQRLIMVSPPVGLIDFSFLGRQPRIKLVVSGSQDDIAPTEAISKMMPTWNPAADFVVIQGADHFYGGKISELEAVVGDFLRLG